VQTALDDASPRGRAATERLPWLVAGLAFAAFLPSLLAGYVYDDGPLIAENYYAQSFAFLGRAFRTHLWDVHAFGSAGIGPCSSFPCCGTAV